MFSNQAIDLPPPEENDSSIFLYNSDTEEGVWFTNASHVSEIHEQSNRVLPLESIPGIGLGLVFPHGVQVDGDVIYIQDHMDVKSIDRAARINAFDIEGSFLWSYIIPTLRFIWSHCDCSQ